MSDLISRKALIDILAKYKFGAIKSESEREYTKETVLNFVKEQPSVTETNVGCKWIPCSERLPSEQDYPEQKYRVLASCSDGIVRNASIKSMLNGEKKYALGHIEFTYEAWMPLPESYKGEQGVSFIGIRETAFFSLDLQKEASEYARKKESEGWKITEAYTGSGYSVTSEYSISFIKGEQDKGEQHETD